MPVTQQPKVFPARHFVFEHRNPDMVPHKGDTVEYTQTVGYRLYQDQPFKCRELRWLEGTDGRKGRMGSHCQCENEACYGVQTTFTGTVTAVNYFMDNSVEVRTDQGHTLTWEYPHGDAC